MKITYDSEANAAKTYLKEIPSGGVAKTYCCDPIEVNGMVNLDFDEKGVLIGIEILDARAKLPKEVLDAADK